METGYRRSQLGVSIPRDIIRLFVCTYNGTEVFRAELHPAIAANPFIVFSTVATESGTIAFHWTGDDGFSVRESVAITVSECGDLRRGVRDRDGGVGIRR